MKEASASIKEDIPESYSYRESREKIDEEIMESIKKESMEEEIYE